MEGKQKKVFEISGQYKEKGKIRTFTRKVQAFNENNAIDVLLSLVGSEHKVKRRHVEITEAKELKQEKEANK